MSSFIDGVAVGLSVWAGMFTYSSVTTGKKEGLFVVAFLVFVVVILSIVSAVLKRKERLDKTERKRQGMFDAAKTVLFLDEKGFVKVFGKARVQGKEFSYTLESENEISLPLADLVKESVKLGDWQIYYYRDLAFVFLEGIDDTKLLYRKS